MTTPRAAPKTEESTPATSWRNKHGVGGCRDGSRQHPGEQTVATADAQATDRTVEELGLPDLGAGKRP